MVRVKSQVVFTPGFSSSFALNRSNSPPFLEDVMQLQETSWSTQTVDCSQHKRDNEALEVGLAPSFSDIELVYAPSRPHHVDYRESAFNFSHLLSLVLFLAMIVWGASYIVNDRPVTPVLVVDREELLERQADSKVRFVKGRADNPVASLVYLGALASKLKEQRGRAAQNNTSDLESSTHRTR